MKSNTFYLLIALVVLLIGGVYNLKRNQLTTDIPNEKVIQDFKADLTIESKNKTETYNINQYIGKKILATLSGLYDGNVKFSGVKDEDIVITAINGVEINPKKHEYWSVSVNGEEIATMAAVRLVQNKDNILIKINSN